VDDCEKVRMMYGSPNLVRHHLYIVGVEAGSCTNVSTIDYIPSARFRVRVLTLTSKQLSRVEIGNATARLDDKQAS
jgi:hypothetical protein